MARPKYPHLLPPDIKVWDRFLAKYGKNFPNLQYDVRVGTPTIANPGSPAKIRAMASDLTMKRIDAVSHTDTDTFLFEITHTAGLKAIGQLIAYPILYKKMFPDAPEVTPILVAGTLIPDIEFILDELFILQYVV